MRPIDFVGKNINPKPTSIDTGSEAEKLLQMVARKSRKGIWWTAINREKILNVFDYQCVECGYRKFKCSLEIHHIDRNRRNNNFDNIVVLCSNCHNAVHRGNHEITNNNTFNKRKIGWLLEPIKPYKPKPTKSRWMFE